jgi:hypothetical protein
MRGFLTEERGITPIVGAVLVIALISISMSVYLEKVTPDYQRKNEYDHMHEVRAAFLEFQSDVLSRVSGSVEVPMSPDTTPLFTLPQKSGELEVRPAEWVKHFLPVKDAYVDEEDSDGTYGTDGKLSVRSSPGKNRWTYLEFDFCDDDENFVDNIGWNDISEAWLVLYCENLSKFMGDPWDDGINYHLEDGLGDTAWDQFNLPDLPLDVEIRQVADDTWDEAAVTWDDKPEIAEGIPGLEWPYENSQVIKDNEAWYTWDITRWVVDRFSSGSSMDICLKPVYEGSTQERYATFSSKESTGLTTANENEAFYTYDDESYDTNKPTGHSPFNLPYIVIIYENGTQPGPPIVDNPDDPDGRWGAFIEGGSVSFSSDYYQFPNHSFTFESGAVMQEQYGHLYQILITDPGLLVGEYIEGDEAIAVTINRYRIVSYDDIRTTSDVLMNFTVTENTDYRVEPIDENGDGAIDPNRENLLVTVRTGYEWPWKRYLRDVAMNWDQSANQGGLEWWANYYYDSLEDQWGIWAGNVAEFEAKHFIPKNTRFYIWGNIEDPAVKDIYYYDHTYDVKVNIGV